METRTCAHFNPCVVFINYHSRKEEKSNCKMLLKSKYIQPGVQVSILIEYLLYSCFYAKLGKGGVRKAFYVFIVKYLF